MNKFVTEIDLHGLDVEGALRKVDVEIRSMRKSPARFKALKCIHGYSRGDRIARALHARLDELKQDDRIAHWVQGAEWNIHNAALMELLAAVHLKDGNLLLSSDSDFRRGNPGITVAIVWAQRS